MRKIACALFLVSAFSLTAANFTVGVIYNLTGAQASLDKPALKGFNLAFDQLQISQNPILRDLKHAVNDGKSNPKILEEEAQRLFQIPELIAVIGINDDDMAHAVAIQARRAKKVFITSGATSPLLTEEFPTYTFLVAFGDNAQAAAVAEYAAKTLNLKSGFVLYNIDAEYTRLLAEYFSASFPKNGGMIVGSETFSDQTTDLSSQIRKIQEMSPQMIYLAAEPEQITPLIDQIRSAGITTPIFGGDSFDTPLLADHLSEVYYSCHVLLSPNSSDPEVLNFIKEYREKYGVAPESSFAALGYDACNLFAAALAQADSPSSEELVKSLNRINFQGVTGEIRYVHGIHTPRKPVTIVLLQEGKKKEVAKFIPHHVPLPGKRF
jgi:branched-chain amino acid transport system substrate-binding protein